MIWHEVECGRYRADLPLWRELARPAAGGRGARRRAGTGRVALDLARGGTRVTALDLDPALLAELERRAAGLPVEAVSADARAFALDDSASTCCLVPMQTCSCSAARRSGRRCPRRAPRICAPAALLAVRIVMALGEFDGVVGRRDPPPDGARSRARLLQPRACASAARRDHQDRARAQIVAPDGGRKRAGEGATSSTSSSSLRQRDAAGAEEAEAGPAPRPPPDRRHRGPRRQRGGDAPCLKAGVSDARCASCALYPDLMNIYADRGNLLVLERRCAWRGIGFELRTAGLGEPIDRGRARPVLHRRRPGSRPAPVRRGPGGAQGRGPAARRLRGAVVLGVCGGYQLLGRSYTLGEERIAGVGLLDVRHGARAPGERLIGNVAIEAARG